MSYISFQLLRTSIEFRRQLLQLNNVWTRISLTHSGLATNVIIMDDSDLSFASILLGFRHTGDPSQVDLGNAKNMMVSCKIFDIERGAFRTQLKMPSNYHSINYWILGRQRFDQVCGQQSLWGPSSHSSHDLKSATRDSSCNYSKEQRRLYE